MKATKTAVEKTATKKVTPEIGEYNGKPMIILNPGAKFLFQFGATKAALIVENIEAIRQFAKDHAGK